MKGETSPFHHLKTGIHMYELLLAVHTLEFEALKKEQEGRRRDRDNLAYFTLAALVTILIGVSQTNQKLFLLGVPFACVVLGWTRAANDEKIHAIRVYIRDNLTNQIRQVLEAAGDGQETSRSPQHEQLTKGLLLWESASTNGRRRRRILHLTADMMLFVIPAATATLVAAGALGKALGAAAAAVIVVLLLLVVSALAWEILAKSR